MRRISVLREQSKAVSSFAPTANFKAGLKVDFGAIQIIFADNPTGKNQSIFTLTLQPEHHFKALAQAMVYANASEAIKAFGAVLEAGIPESREVWVPDMDD
jgi:hypothetical protein